MVILAPKFRDAIKTHEMKLAQSTDTEAHILYVNLDVTSAYIVPRGATSLRVVSGGAWVSYHAADHVLNQHDDLALNPHDAHTATVTALYHQGLVLAITLS